MENSPQSVAIVEDDPNMLRSIERLLNAYGYATEGYASAEAFLAAKPGSRVCCLVLDINLGNMSGIELRRQLTRAGRALPVVFITAADDDMLEQEARDAGCLAFLHKPFAARLMISAIRQAMDSEVNKPENR